MLDSHSPGLESHLHLSFLLPRSKEIFSEELHLLMLRVTGVSGTFGDQLFCLPPFP